MQLLSSFTMFTRFPNQHARALTALLIIPLSGPTYCNTVLDLWGLQEAGGFVIAQSWSRHIGSWWLFIDTFYMPLMV